jgi:hypothetical protein
MSEIAPGRARPPERSKAYLGSFSHIAPVAWMLLNTHSGKLGFYACGSGLFRHFPWGCLSCENFANWA